jgi:hypothetical protein
MNHSPYLDQPFVPRCDPCSVCFATAGDADNVAGRTWERSIEKKK